MEMRLEMTGDVAVITWNDNENRINLDSLGRLNEILDELEPREGPLAVVWTGTGKFFSNGLDVELFARDPSSMEPIIKLFDATMGRLLLFPAYTVSALNGHTFAGGALLSMTTDYRVMRSDRGYWCMNELDIGMVIPIEMNAVLKNRLPRATWIDAIMTARRFSAADALARGIVEEIAEESVVLPRALEVAAAMAGKDRAIIAYHKRQVYGDVARLVGFLPPV
ncbi:MAG: enoyl-CoA hydratase/isomerase family protein [Actinomycetota bacterium]